MNCRPLLALVLTAAATWAMAGPSDKCQLVKITEWSVRKDHYRPVVDGSINGQKIGVLLDTGAFQTAILRPAAERLGLRRVMLDGQRVYGIGGETRAEAAYVDELNIAGSVRKDWPALVVGEHGFSGDVALLLGHEFFEQLDVEFDLAQRVVRLFQPQNCERAWLGYWSRNASMVPLETNSRIHLTVRINGQPILAMLDSGVGYSKLSREAALVLGATPDTPGARAAGCVYGLGAQRYDSWLAPFESFSLGDEVIRNPSLRFADVWRHNKREATGSNIPRSVSNVPEMLLGSDFLRAHRVYVAHSQRKLYFSYVGGKVFPDMPGKSCSELKI
jgi:clan AA aspartic protease (TIGR02281 family)